MLQRPQTHIKSQESNCRTKGNTDHHNGDQTFSINHQHLLFLNG